MTSTYLDRWPDQIIISLPRALAAWLGDYAWERGQHRAGLIRVILADYFGSARMTRWDLAPTMHEHGAVYSEILRQPLAVTSEVGEQVRETSRESMGEGRITTWTRAVVEGWAMVHGLPADVVESYGDSWRRVENTNDSE